VRRVLKELKQVGGPLKRIIIAGGGHVGKRLALALEDDHQVKSLRKLQDAQKKIANDLHNTVVLLGDWHR